MRSWRRRWSCSSVFLEVDYSCKMGKTKKDTNAKVAGQWKQIKESAAEQLCVVNCAWIIFQWVSMSPTIRRYWIHQRLYQHPSYCCQVPKLLQNLSFLLPRFFCPPYTIAKFIRVANFRFFTHWFTFIRSSLFSVFRTGPWFKRGLCLLIT